MRCRELGYRTYEKEKCPLSKYELNASAVTTTEVAATPATTATTGGSGNA